MIKDGFQPDEDDENDDRFHPPCPKRLRVDDDCQLAEAVLAYDANVKDTADAPNTYQEAIPSEDSSK